MKIVFILEHFHPYIGGVEKLFFQLTQELANKGTVVRVLTTRFDTNLQKKEIINNVEVIRLNLTNRYLFSFFGFFYMIKHVKGFDLIHTTTYNAAFPAFFVGLFSKKKVIVTFHEYWGKLWFSLPFLGIFEKILFWSYEQLVTLLPFNTIVAVSDFTKASLEKKLHRTDIERIYNGVAYPPKHAENNPLPKTFTFTYYGRLGVSKGIELILEACKILQNETFDFTCNLIIPKTPGKFYRKILSIIDETHIKSKIKLYHNLPEFDLKNVLKTSNCIVIPSYSEGFCFSAVEAIALGIPVIISNNGALPEVVSGKHIIMKHNDAENVASALKQAKENIWEETPLKKYELQKQVNKYIDLYENML